MALSFTAQIRGRTDSFNTLFLSNGNKSDSTDPVISEEEADLTLHDAVNLALLVDS